MFAFIRVARVLAAGAASILFVSPSFAQATTTRVSVAPDRSQGNNSSYSSSFSADGRYVAFQSFASNLVAEDTNGSSDIFVRGPLFGGSSAFTAVDVTQCLRIVAGLSEASPTETARFNVETGNASVTLEDAVCIARKVAGLDANP